MIVTTKYLLKHAQITGRPSGSVAERAFPKSR
jgi:hypothetical protein